MLHVRHTRQFGIKRMLVDVQEVRVHALNKIDSAMLDLRQHTVSMQWSQNDIRYCNISSQ
jgi:hypothetical protein